MNKKDKGAGKNTGLPLKPDQQVQELRRQAERIVRQQDALPPVDVESLTLEKSQKLLQELQVHQVELSMQNEELLASRVELEESRARFFELYDLAPVGYLTVNEQGFITLANLTVATLLGVERSALDNTPFSLYILKEDQDYYYRYRMKLFESGEDQQCELRMVKDDGIAFWAKLQGNFVPAEKDGDPFCRLTLSDITESKKAEEALRVSEERFRVAQDISPDGFTILHPLRNEKNEIIDFTWVYENKAVARVNETDPQKVIGKRLLDLFPDHSGTPIFEAYIHVANTGKPQIFEEVYVGEVVSRPTWLRMVIVPMAEDIAILALDISKRKQTEEELRELNEYLNYYRLAVDNMQDYRIAVVDKGYCYKLVSKQYLDNYGLIKTDIVGKTVTELMGAEIFESAVKPKLDLAFEGKTVIYTDWFDVPALGKRFCEVSYYPIWGEDRTVSSITATIHDITDRKKVEDEIYQLNAELEQRVKERTAELEAVNKELESFAYSISHDFRAPLRALNAFSANLTEKYSDQLEEQGLHYLNRISNAALYMSDLVDDVLSLSRISRAELKEQEVDISHLAEEILKDLQETEPERQVKMEIAPGLSAKGDLTLLKAALENLIGNAWKFSAKEAQAEIKIGQTIVDGEDVFFLRDNGAGFNMAYAERLFGAFQRLHGVDEFSGTGIGLATVQRIIIRHGGRIWAKSEVGKGATFYFTLKS